MGQFHLVTIANPEQCNQCQTSLLVQAWKRRFHKALYCESCAISFDTAEATKAAKHKPDIQPKE